MPVQMTAHQMLRVQVSVAAPAGIQRQVSFVQVGITRYKGNSDYF